MSRIGKLPIELSAGTQAKIEGDFIVIKGPKGELKEKLNKLVKIEISEKEIKISVKRPEDKRERSLWGLYRSLIFNMVKGVNEEYEKKLEVKGVGYNASVSGKQLKMNLGYSHPIVYDIPDGINIEVDKNIISIKGISKQAVGEVAAQIRKFRKPEPYKGSGIKYEDEIIRRKAGKTAAKGA